ncbi:phosphatidylinositol 4-phosphate 5-kinase 8-like [Cucurbita maxima]|uniref:Phosphatidylinositol 4-phosphate 5-kinase n=1 Tax=Cucurbita maxima TaxID=3661 RepID=A0A6J1HVG1_CUCMA|nr:phosphatidylinositol 4-phosphate 5-kinase 8-like [Cucurbita maxima]XP_022967573.1 phosphatidylinositol 4-phosphate 5-kinase 8-like [Cucurbita maxima]XP_022967574.1 phosphatidylinositol 4-phosphate 5-kinase 8-like [Cucurbita maxima]XP_022967575.1 phosphatidylinositol 4-phosphate 5-kinase 8-like [Cucurbita maxima]XP_022967576.1 phosphatidylinositol 4-phosphate 5-kinase 8-like [Cucurbita maxima]XP_022967577.1 phosphatidylinositol 4-phosphate 5-kinase 8-like [Cucurbita maxima]XP_022967578.1 ph
MEDFQGTTENVFANGDVYIGSFKNSLLYGKGKYTWFDGTTYDGDWEDGKMTGKGKIIWPSGAKYEGEISGGYLHGFGTFNYSDGSIYNGDWRMNIHHGIGQKLYANLDIYDGSWKEGMPEGCGRYFWSSGNSYIGNWKGGQMCGKGIMKWVNGDHFIGFWLNGFRHGSGVYHFADGAYYFGSWSRGLKDGKGTFYPAGSKPPSLEKWHNFLGYDIHGKGFLSRTLSLNSEKEKAPKHGLKHSFSEKFSVTGISSAGLSNWPRSMDINWGLSDPTREALADEDSCMMSHTSDQGQHNVAYKDRTVYEREYVQGVLIQERVKDYEEIFHRSKEQKKTTVKEARKVSCINFFESRRSYYLMLNLQLGIRYTVGKITPVPMREVRSSDFGKRARIVMYFPGKGSQFTPPHYSVDFHWKDYCPMVFRNLREMFKLDAAEYMMSICGDDGLRELSSPGKSGSIFYLSQDDRFVIKTLKKSELKVLLKMLPKYYGHVKEHENTLITKFFGLHRITIYGHRKVRFVVMGNMFCTELKIHRRYDLKGSTLGRYTHGDKSRDGITMKDLDLSYEFHMDKLLRQSLFKQISLDCMFLESLNIIDYSLLLGVHFRAPEKLKALLEPPATVHNPDNLHHDDEGESSVSEPMISPKGLLLVTHEPSSVTTAPGPHIRGRPLKTYSLGDREVDVLLPGTARFRVQLGVNMPAQASHKLLDDKSESSEVELFELYDVVLYMGIIDILQEYNLKKKLEHACKSLRFDPLSISVVEPHLYATRFKRFLEKVFHDLP